MLIPKGLTCPVCGGKLEKSDNSLKCEAGHSFDFAKSGYINLLNPGKKKEKRNSEPNSFLIG